MAVAHKSILVLSAALLVSIAVALLLGRNLQRERARADALAERLMELEPLEKGGGSVPTDVNAKPQSNAQPGDRRASGVATAERAQVDAPEQPKPTKAYSGSLRARQQIERLQAALASGTPLEEYQIQPLIDAIDQALRDLEQERGAAGQGGPRDAEAEAEANRRIVQMAADILFESQLEKLIELLDRELEAKNTSIGR